jgi:hypothetical protein
MLAATAARASETINKPEMNRQAAKEHSTKV